MHRHRQADHHSCLDLPVRINHLLENEDSDRHLLAGQGTSILRNEFGAWIDHAITGIGSARHVLSSNEITDIATSTGIALFLGSELFGSLFRPTT